VLRRVLVAVSLAAAFHLYSFFNFGDRIEFLSERFVPTFARLTLDILNLKQKLKITPIIKIKLT
jgi:hypothetical protein